MLATDDAIRNHVSPNIPVVREVEVNGSAGAWVAVEPFDMPALNFNSYILLIEGASAAYEMTWEDSPSVPYRGITVPANTPLTTPRCATPSVEASAAWPSFRAIGVSGFTLRMVMFAPLP